MFPSPCDFSVFVYFLGLWLGWKKFIWHGMETTFRSESPSRISTSGFTAKLRRKSFASDMLGLRQSSIFFLFLYVLTKVLFFFQELVYTNIHTRQKAPQVRSCEYGGNPTPPLVTVVVDEKFRDSRAHVKIRPYCPVRVPVIHFWYFSIFSTSDLQRPKQSEFYHKANVRQCTRGIWTTGKT